jgi:YD repeat-containing protein
VVDGAGTSGALTTTYTLDGTGEATQSTDGLGATSSATYDADHDVLASTDANGNVTTNAYQYVGPNGSTGFPIVQQPTLLNTVEKSIGQ